MITIGTRGMSQFFREIDRPQPKRIIKPKLTKKQEKIINQKQAPKVNMIYALSMILEGLTLDLGGKEDIYNIAVKLREQVKGTSEQSAESFGDWSDHVAEHLLPLSSKDKLFPIICEKIYRLSRQMEEVFRSKDPHFDFYQKDLANALKSSADLYEIDKDLLIKFNEVIKILMFE
ncbi:MAG: hypothetical protein JZU53_07130 [Paludibacter sp.]|nr:hypothetical protein [Paludibacter sp.]